jgi:hypothetical protein
MVYPNSGTCWADRMATKEELQAYLAEAEKAYHSLMMGGAVRVTVDQNGERVEFSAANANKLLQYIMHLQTQLGIRRPMGPAGVIF